MADLFKMPSTQSGCSMNLKQRYELSKPIPKQSLDFLRNLQIIRFYVDQDTPMDEALRIYYNEYIHLFYQNKRLNRQFIEVVERKNKLVEIVINKKKVNQFQGGKVKRKRRYARYIQRFFQCPLESCPESYGREGSLTTHVKLKHNEFYGTGQYEIYISELLRDLQ